MNKDMLIKLIQTTQEIEQKEHEKEIQDLWDRISVYQYFKSENVKVSDCLYEGCKAVSGIKIGAYPPMNYFVNCQNMFECALCHLHVCDKHSAEHEKIHNFEN